jgi:hypothetical protein
VEIRFPGQRTIREIDIYGLQTDYNNPSTPTLEMTSRFALTDFTVEYATGPTTWAVVPGGNVVGEAVAEDKVWRQFIFDPITTDKIRVKVTKVKGDNRTQVVEIQAFEQASP